MVIDAAFSPAQALAALRQRHADEPTDAGPLLAELLSLAETLDGAAPDEALRIELARFAGVLALELRNPSVAVALVERAQACAGLDEAIAAELDCYLARADIQQQRYEPARQRLDQAQRCQAPLVQALCLSCRAQLAHREGEMAQAEALAAAALQAFAPLGWSGPWVQSYATQTISLRQLGQQQRRAALLEEGLQQCAAQRRWGEAANLASGLFDMALEAGDLPLARQALARSEALAAQERGDAQAVGKAMTYFSRARLLAAEGRYAEACADLRQTLSQQRHRLVAYEYALRLDQLADWLLRCGQPQQALEAAAEAQQIQREQLRLAQQRDLSLLREALEVQQAERERSASEAHARRMEQQQAELAQTLARQRALQEELIETRKLAGLGQLLIGLSQQLATPLREALAAVEEAQTGLAALSAGIGAGAAITRRQLLDTAQAGADQCQQAQVLVERGIAEIDTYRGLRDEA